MASPIDLVKRGIVAPKHWSIGLAWTVAAVVVPALLRWSIDRGANGFPFATFLPAILWVSIFLDWRLAVLAGAGSLAMVGTFFVQPGDMDPSWQRAALLALYLLTLGSMILTGHLLRRAVIDLERRTAEAEAFGADLQHRSRNALQVVKALASRASKATDPADFYKTLGGRITVLIKANDLFGFRQAALCDIAEIVSAALQSFPSSRIAVSGSPCRVDRETGNPLIMALYELGANAARYGALSGEEGRVTLAWTMGAQGEAELVWQEHGGPPVSPPAGHGLGARILAPQGGLCGVEQDFDPAGLRCRLRVRAVA